MILPYYIVLKKFFLHNITLKLKLHKKKTTKIYNLGYRSSPNATNKRESNLKHYETSNYSPLHGIKKILNSSLLP